MIRIRRLNCEGREARGKYVGGKGCDSAGHVEFTTRAD